MIASRSLENLPIRLAILSILIYFQIQWRSINSSASCFSDSDGQSPLQLTLSRPDSLPCLMQYRVREFNWLVSIFTRLQDDTSGNLPDSLWRFYFPAHFQGKRLSSYHEWHPAFSVIYSVFYSYYIDFYYKPTKEKLKALIRLCVACHSVTCGGPLIIFDGWLSKLQQ